MSYLFNTFLYDPLLNGLVLLYKYVTWEDLGLAIILLTIIIRVVLYPLFYKSMKNQALLQKLQPEVERIQQSHNGDKEKQASALLALYREHKVNPFSSFFLIILQLPILIALYQVFLSEFSGEALKSIYSFIDIPQVINSTLLGLIDLKEKSIIIVVLATIAQYIQSALALPEREGAEETPSYKMAKNMMYIGPALTLLILGNLPAAVGVYWFTSSVFSVGQQWLINKQLEK
jgi:YidC/Oxa1 family membrane protein insertase